MTLIPFSILQLVYFGAGLAEVGLLLLMLGLASVPLRGPSRLGLSREQSGVPPAEGTLGPVGRGWRSLGSRHERQEHSA